MNLCEVCTPVTSTRKLKIDAIMAIDVFGKQDMAPPQHTPIKKVKTDLSFK
jgi:hypothetical protein